jgi:hypothetical protein
MLRFRYHRHMTLSRQQVMAIAAEACCDVRTVERIYDGKPSKKLVTERVVAAAKKLKIAAPPSQND